MATLKHGAKPDVANAPQREQTRSCVVVAVDVGVSGKMLSKQRLGGVQFICASEPCKRLPWGDDALRGVEGRDFQPASLYRPTAPNRPRFCSATCRGREYRKWKDQAIDQELVRAAIAIQRAREAL